MTTQNEGGPLTQLHEPLSQVQSPTDLPTSLREEPQSTKASFLAPLRLANFRKLIAGQTVSRLGDGFYFVAIPWLVLRNTSSPIALSVVLGVSAGALGASTLAGGVLADRYGPRALMLGADIARLVIISALAFLTLFGAVPLWAVLALTGLLGLATGLFYPASSAMTPHLVETDDLQAAISLSQTTVQVSNFIGPGIAGAVLAATRLAFGFVIDAASFAVSVISLVAIRMPARGASDRAVTTVQGKSREGGIAALGEALRFLRTKPFLLTVIALSLLTNFAVNGLFEVGIPLLLKQWIGISAGPRAQGFVVGGFGLGSIVGALIAGFAGRLRHKTIVAIGLLLPSAALLGWIPLTHDVYLATGIFATIGVLVGCSNVFWLTLAQRGVPMDMLGRVMSIVLIGSFVGQPLSIFAYGAFASIVPDVSILFFAGSALFGVATLIALTQKVMWLAD